MRRRGSGGDKRVGCAWARIDMFGDWADLPRPASACCLTSFAWPGAFLVDFGTVSHIHLFLRERDRVLAGVY